MATEVCPHCGKSIEIEWQYSTKSFRLKKCETSAEIQCEIYETMAVSPHGYQITYERFHKGFPGGIKEVSRWGAGRCVNVTFHPSEETVTFKRAGWAPR